jgi:hypothetical protein
MNDWNVKYLLRRSATARTPGWKTYMRLARPVSDSTERERAAQRFSDHTVDQGPTQAVRSLLRRLGLDY